MAAAASVASMLAACSSSGGVPPAQVRQQRQLDRYISASPLLAQCAISRGSQALLSSAQKHNSANKGQAFLRGRKVEPTNHNGSAFTDWWDNAGGAAVKFSGRELGDWEQWAADHYKLSPQVCGTTIEGTALKRLYTQLYVHWAGELNNDSW